MSLILGALTSRITGPIAIAAAAILLVLLVSARCTVSGLEDDLRDERVAHARTTADLAQCRENTATLEGSLRTQNAAVAAMEAEAMEAAARATEAARLAAIANARANTNAAQVLALRPVGEVCNAALNLIRGPIQ